MASTHPSRRISRHIRNGLISELSGHLFKTASADSMAYVPHRATKTDDKDHERPRGIDTDDIRHALYGNGKIRRYPLGLEIK